MTSKAAVLERFDEPLVVREYPISPLAEGEVLVRVRAAGVCGSDVHMWRGKDPRTPLPIILGHEGVGEVAEVGGEKRDVFGGKVKPGDLVVWERGIMCGRCYYCVIKKQPALCPERQTYGISVGCADPPHLRGAYAEYIHLLPNAHLITIDEQVDPAVLVSATCSGATAAHTVELCGVKPGDTVVVLGPGPVGLWVLAFCLARGATQAIVLGTAADKERLAMARELGATETINIDELSPDERLARIKDATHGLGANVVVECTGSPKAVEEGIRYVAPYGVFAIPGIATPVGTVPFALYEDLSRKSVRVQGVWVSDTSHLYQALQLVLSGRFAFDRLVTHRLPLEQATEALEAVERREAVKAVLVP